MPTVLALIPARSGSKGIPDKNIRRLNGKPLLAYSIECARQSGTVGRVIVSTDSERYAEIAREYGAETPFLRPADISGDAALDVDVFAHALRFLDETEGYRPDLCVHLRPTHPVRGPGLVDEMVRLLLAHPEWDSLRSVSPARSTPYKMWTLGGDGALSPVATCAIPEAYNAPRQALPRAYLQNACVDVVRSGVVLGQRSMTGRRIGGYVQDIDFDIDSESELLRAELYLELTEKLRSGKKLTICSDIDGLIAQKTPANDYAAAQPIPGTIRILNELHRRGHTVRYFTARGGATGLDWEAVTKAQLAAWGAEHSALQFGKPAADIYLDDRFWDVDKLHAFFD